MTTVQAACFSKNMIRSLLRSLRLTSVAPASSTAWTWNTDFAVSRPIMAMLIAGGSFSAGPHDRHRQGAVHPILVPVTLGPIGAGVEAREVGGRWSWPVLAHRPSRPQRMP